MQYELSENEEKIILAMRAEKLASRKRKLSREIALAVAPNYFAAPQGSICEVFRNRILSNGFAIPDFSEVASNDFGSASYDLAGCYLAVTWYRMSSGNFEIVAYVN